MTTGESDADEHGAEHASWYMARRARRRARGRLDHRMLDERPNRAALRPRAAAWQLGPRIKGTGGVDAEMGDVDLV